jgi:hypothetical protein
MNGLHAVGVGLTLVAGALIASISLKDAMIVLGLLGGMVLTVYGLSRLTD